MARSIKSSKRPATWRPKQTTKTPLGTTSWKLKKKITGKETLFWHRKETIFIFKM